jgi:geranylgeranyl reductase family protein
MRLLAVDVAVIGAGPGGSAAAIRLCERGVDVALVDRAVFPREKVCGDGLTPRAMRVLEDLGVWTSLRPHAVGVANLAILDMIEGSQHWGRLPHQVATRPRRGAVVPRRVLDDSLRARAVSEGARFVPGAMMTEIAVDRGATIRISGVGPEGPLTIVARGVVVADGAAGAIGRRCRRTRSGTSGIAVRQYWELGGMAPAFHVCAPLREGGEPIAGYGWVFPLQNGIANVGVGLVSSPLSRRRVKNIFAGFTRHLREAVPEWRNGRPLGRLSGGLLRSGLVHDPGSIEGALLVGDAVGAINPFTGEGIAQAMETGQIAADAFLAHLGDPCALNAAYRAGLLATFPETTNNLASQPWLIDRGRYFASEFWQEVSCPSSLVGRSVRRIVLEEGEHLSAPPHDRSALPVARAERSWKLLECRIAASRPVVAQLVRSVRNEDASLRVAMAHYWRVARERRLDSLGHAEVVALALGTLVMCMALVGDRSSASLAPHDRSTERRARWAVDTTAIGVGDLLLASLFALLSRLPPGLSSRCIARAVRALERVEGCVGDVARTATVQRDTAISFVECLTIEPVVEAVGA